MFFCDQADLKRYSRLKNQSASIDASGSAGFQPVREHPKKKKSGGLGVNKRNRGYPADFEFIERPLNINKTITFVGVAIGVEGTHSLRDSNSRRKLQLCDKSKESDDNRIKENRLRPQPTWPVRPPALENPVQKIRVVLGPL